MRALLRGSTPTLRAAVLAAPIVIALIAWPTLWPDNPARALAVLGPVGLLPAIWIALYGTRRQVALVVACIAALFWAPVIVVEGAADQPSWELATVWTLCILLVAPVVHTAVGKARRLEPVEVRLNALLRAATEHLIIATDLDGRLTMFNRGAERMLGWTAEQMLGVCPIDVIFDADEVLVRADELGIDPAFDVVVHAAASGGVDIRDWTFVSRDRTRRTVSLSVTAKRDAAGRLVGFVGVGTDVTDARQAHRELQAQNQIHQLLLQHIPNTTVGLLDDQLRWVTAGGTLPASLGLDKATLVGRSLDDVFNARDAAIVRETVEKGRDHAAHAEFDASNGRSYALDAVAIRGANRNRLMLTVLRDITEARLDAERNRRMSQALAVSEQNFRTAFEDAPFGTVLISADTATAARFLRVNTAFAHLLGRSTADLTGAPVNDVTHEDDQHLVCRTHTEEGSGALQKRFMHSSGQQVWVQLTYSLARDAQGEPSYFIGHVEDINLRKESERSLLAALEQQRAATAALQHLDRIRAEVVATISHELRTPLTSIHGYLELLNECGDEDLSATSRRMVEIAARNADRLAGLLDDLLWLARSDASSDVPASAPRLVDLRDVVRSAVATTEVTAALRNQTIAVSLPSSAVHASGDADQLGRAVLNLVSNAIKYTDDGGHIEVELYVDGDEACIDVSDDGMGVPADEQRSLFDRFYRGAAAQERAIGGTGLGLAIVKSIVDQHHGRTSVTSIVGHGSRFGFAIPLTLALADVG